MKAGIHPEYKEVKATCSCGNSFVFKSAMTKDSLHLDVCDKCHPFYTGKQRIVDTGGRVDKFNKRFGALGSKK
jgi:large subunit ribosomal protein L31